VRGRRGDRDDGFRRRGWIVSTVLVAGLGCAAAWSPTMAIIFVGASTPGATWPDATVVVLGNATGLIAGTVFALVSWPLIPLLEGSSLANRIVVTLVRSAADAADIVIVPGHPERNR
jgi:hypothetical protein